MVMTGRRRPRPRGRLGRALALLLLFLASAAAVIVWWAVTRPNMSHEIPEYMARPHPIMIEGQWSQSTALGEGEGLLVPLSIAQRLLGDGVHYEAATETIILTTSTEVLHFKTGALDATLNSKPITLSFAARKSDEEGELYLPFAPLKQLFGIQADVGAQSGIVTLQLPESTLQTAVVPENAGKNGVQLRSGPKRSYPIVEDMPAGTGLTIWGEEEGWYKVQSAEGFLGYAEKSDVVLSSIRKVPSAASAADEEPFVPWKLTGKRINLTWEAVYTANPDTRSIGELTGVNVVSPTWFELSNGEGQIVSKADAGYSKWARDQGMQIWGLFSNGFDEERTHQALASYDVRLKMIQQLLAYAKTFSLQGINIDYESVKTEDKDNLIQFVRELTPLLHEQGLVVSIDVTPKSNSELWSLFLDRKRLSQTVDYLILMAYDEHWASSPEAGSVSSLPWTEASIKRLLEEDDVPKDKLILGMPLYTRLWTENPGEDGGVEVSSKTMSMTAAQKLITDKKLKPELSEETGQHYAEYTEDGATRKIWFEDETSIQARAELIKKYGLAGAATWNRSFADSDIWAVLDKALQSHP
ncbi:glycosyl hydrolase family 18 protein [Cohnella lubricantis]|uniref:SH3 domain-containing protein n=1 Tax=Cohnella lubricantis TaxID=2163172 RepID=A0A841TG65_9BACL|nr:glycosyl hydrolase family 18 protein [Cohnella lubricantis]MBB6677937.1 SH3 domain-containing protein [Cohnella lubricantis]